MAKKESKDTIIEAIDKAITAIEKIKASGYGWDIESTIAESRDSLIQAKGLIKKT